MINYSTVRVAEILYKDKDITKFYIINAGKNEKCINYNHITGDIQENDEIVLNTTAVDLGLGTGGHHFVLYNITRGNTRNIGEGHIMKLKYTPVQFNCLSSEAQESSYHDVFNSFESLDRMPIIVGSLHSMLAPAAICFNEMKENAKVIYIMTDSGALPIWISDIVRRLKGEGILHGAITCGNSFGGDLECVNVYTALIAAKEIYKADAAIVCMGPGIVGTDTKFGFSGIEQGYILDAVNNYKGFSIAIPRISFADNRERHYGISHHSLTVLDKICNTRVNVAIPKFEETKEYIIKQQIDKSNIENKHNIYYVDTSEMDNILVRYKDYFEKMGRSYEEDKEFFMACGAAALLGHKSIHF